jgi:hypothetical protein
MGIVRKTTAAFGPIFDKSAVAIAFIVRGVGATAAVTRAAAAVAVIAKHDSSALAMIVL